jgi:ELWxxDGT repeat protein
MSLQSLSRFIRSNISKRMKSLRELNRKRRRNRIFLRVESLEDRRVLATNPLVIDLNLVPVSSNPQAMAEVNGVVYFNAASGDRGQELWRTDGTASGTFLVKDIVPGAYSSYPTNLTNVGGTLYFKATDPATGQPELFKSNGTAEGTAPVDGAFGSYYPEQITDVNGVAFFTAWRQTGTFSGRELWKSDGTAAGTVQVRDIARGQPSSGPLGLTNVNGTLFFSASTATSGYELWKSNGVSAGTVLVKEIAATTDSSSPHQLTNVDGTLFFAANNVTNGVELWKSNGTAAGTVIVKDIAGGGAGSYPTELTAVGTTLFFQTGSELWKSNGVAAGTVQVETLPGGSSSPTELTNVNGTLFFAAYGDGYGNNVWKSNGTAAGTMLVKDLNTIGYSSYPQNLTNINGTLYFSADAGDGTARELFSSDGTIGGTLMIKNIHPTTYYGSNPNYFTAVNGNVVFAASDSNTNRELWISNGTTSGTVLLKEINSFSANAYLSEFAVVGSIMYFAASDGINGVELWKTNGTATGTSMVKNIGYGAAGSNPTKLTNVGGVLYFSAYDPSSGYELWKSNGTAAGTVMVKEISPAGYSSSPDNLTAVGSTLYFVANDNVNGRELWKSNGLAAGTVMVKNINTAAGTSSYPVSLTAVGSTLFFSADDGTNGRELWKSNGVAAGTVIVKDIYSAAGYSSLPESLTAVGSTLYFTARDGVNGRELWKSNGLSAGTVMVKDIGAGGPYSSYPTELVNVGGTLYFAANEGLGVIELFKSNGVAAGTVPVEGTEDIINDPSRLTNVNGTLFFRAFDEQGSTGQELWKSNGTAAGTTLIKDIIPGFADANIDQFTNVNGTLLFTADLESTGRELWISDGTTAGTRLVVDLWAGPEDSDSIELTNFGGNLAFIGRSNDVGKTLHILGPNTSPVVSTPAGPFPATEDSSVGLPPITVSDADVTDGMMQVTLSVTNGSLNVSSSVAGGLSAGDITANNSASVTVTGLISEINATLADPAGVVYAGNPNFFGSDPLIITANDLGNVGIGAPISASLTVTIAVSNVNDPPVITTASGPITYTENAAPVVISATGTSVSDIDSANFNTGALYVFPGTVDANDRLAVRNQGTGAGQIGVSGTTVTFGGVTMGTIFSGLSGGALVITLNANATQAATKALMENITFRTLGETPVGGNREIKFNLIDDLLGDSGLVTTTVSVVPVNDAPTLTVLAGSPSYTEDGPGVVLDSGATAADAEGNLDGGNLTATITVNGTADDRLEVLNEGLGMGQISVAGSFVYFGTASGPVLIGSTAGGTGITPLVVTLNANATSASLQALTRNITFRTLGNNPSALNRTVTLRVTDGGGALSPIRTKIVGVAPVNDAPVLAVPGTNPSYTEDAAAVIVSSTMTVADDDSANFDTGTLTVSLTANGTTSDRLEIRNQGTGAGQIGVSGANVTFGGVTIGSFAGGVGTAPLVVTLNASATIAAVEALARNVTFRVISQNPTTLPRTVQFQLTDGDTGTSNALGMSAAVVAVNDRPVIGVISGSTVYSENTPPILLASTATVADADSANFQGGNLTVNMTAGGTASDRLEIRHVGYGAGQIGLAGASVLYGGLTIGTFTGGVGTTPLVVSLNLSATAVNTRELVRNITFQSIGSPPPAGARTVQFVLNDGDGGTSTSLPVTKTVNINFVPIITLPSASPTYVQGAAALDIDGAATVSDSDSTNFATGVLTVSLTANASASDRVEIRNEGVGAGQIGVSGSNVTFGGIIIGTFAGGVGLTPLTVTFNAAATVSRVQALMRKITFRVDGVGISTLTRTVSFQVTDGDGGTSAAVSKPIFVTT